MMTRVGALVKNGDGKNEETDSPRRHRGPGVGNREVFGNLLEAKVLVEEWRRQYNEEINMEAEVR